MKLPKKNLKKWFQNFENVYKIKFGQKENVNFGFLENFENSK